MKKRLVIVGNAPPKKRMLFFKKSYDTFINESDYVVRINLTPYHGMGMGTKTDCLAIVNIGIPAVEFSYKTRLNSLVISQVKNIFFTRPKEYVSIKLSDGYPLLCKKNLSDEILDFQSISQDVKVDFANKDLYLDLQNLVGEEYMPSSGLVVVAHYLNEIEFHEYDFFLVGFSWEGWRGHHWVKEKLYIESYKNRLQVL